MRPRKLLVVAVCLLLVAALVAGALTGVFASAARAGLAATGLLPEGGRSTVPPTIFDTPARPVHPSSPAPRTPSPVAKLPAAVLPAATPRPVRTSAVRALVSAVPLGKAKGQLSAEVLDVGTGQTVYRRGGTTPLIPASTMKLLTSAAALSLLGPEHRFTTSVVQRSATRVVLVGGGDPYLTERRTPGQYPQRASISDLAAQTARHLAHAKQTRVRVGYDASLFRGPSWNPSWPAGYGDQVTRTSALWVNEGRLSGSPGRRVSNPPRQAAEAFAKALRQRGIRVVAVGAAPKAGGSAKRVAAVSSLPLERIIEQLLLSSDNDAAEAVFRHAGLAAHRGGSIKDALQAVRARLVKLGVWDAGMQIHDGSGLARETRVPADTLVKLLRLAAEDEHPELRALITGLPVAGVEGSLRSRFFTDSTLDARGLVRGKTGTLRRVHSLAGFVRAADGSMLVYAFLVNNPANDYAARLWLDRASAALASCGCR